MNRLIRNIFQGQLNRGLMVKVMGALLLDRTTRKNITWSTDEYEGYGQGFTAEDEILVNLICGDRGAIIQPRLLKNADSQGKRTLERAEVFTPVWVCNLQNNTIDEVWFGRQNVFNTPNENKWKTHHHKIEFPNSNQKTWKSYVDSKRLEITCGEASYIVTPYDTVTGEKIPLENRIGILDRKLRIVNENTQLEDEWLQWTVRAFQSVYGFEYQGDSLLIARLNLLLTFVENLRRKWSRMASEREFLTIAKIISWNLWQMDGLTGTVPGGLPVSQYEEQDLFAPAEDKTDEKEAKPNCRIMDWRSKQSMVFQSLVH
jgi:hypothetical protein